jgi:hypothetical protein
VGNRLDVIDAEEDTGIGKTAAARAAGSMFSAWAKDGME